jgi:hypothetical protein
MSKGGAWVWIWGIAAPLPTLVLAVAMAAYVGTSFHLPQLGFLAGTLIVLLAGREARRMGISCLLAFGAGVAAVIVIGFGVFLYALTHLGVWG